MTDGTDDWDSLMCKVTAGSDQFSSVKAPDATVQSCSSTSTDCKTLWAKSEKAAQDVIDKDKGDPNYELLRNKRISAAYADMYESNKNLKWSGVAAFASEQVGCGMKDAKEMADIGESGLQASSFFREPGDSGAIAAAAFQASGGRTTYNALAKGNALVFSEIYPAMKFYKENGLARLKQCANERQPPLPQDLVKAFEDIDKGDVCSVSARMAHSLK